MFPIYSVVFYFFALLLLVSALMVVWVRNPVRAALFLILAFFASTVLWMLLRAEFLSLVLIFVYVGAVMTLFLFVVMMLNMDQSSIQEKFVRFWPLATLCILLLVGSMVWIISVSPKVLLPPEGVDVNNTTQIGKILYSNYIVPFETVGLILLTALISAIALAFQGSKSNVKRQNIAQQHRASAVNRVRLVSMKAEKNE